MSRKIENDVEHRHPAILLIQAEPFTKLVTLEWCGFCRQKPRGVESRQLIGVSSPRDNAFSSLWAPQLSIKTTRR